MVNEYKFTHICDGIKVQIKSNEVCLSDLVSTFEHFLRGCGFQFDGEMAIVQESVPEKLTPTDVIYKLEEVIEDCNEEYLDMLTTIIGKRYEEIHTKVQERKDKMYNLVDNGGM